MRRLERWGGRQQPSLATVLGLLAAFSLAPPAAADDDAEPDAIDRVIGLDRAGALALAAGEYDFAVRAYREAVAMQASSERLYALGRAHRERYTVEQRRSDKLRAVAYLSRYLALEPTGPHADAATAALADLADSDADGDSDAETRDEARVVVMADNLEAVTRIDGGKPLTLPAFVTLAPGEHHVRVRAPGHRDVERRFQLGPDGIEVVDAALAPAPAMLAVTAPDGAAVHVDGTFVGVAPLAEPVAAPAGARAIAVTLDGHHPYSTRMALERGEEAELEVDLTTTTQRDLAWATLSLGGAGIVTGIVVGVLAVVRDREARDLTTGNLTPEENATIDAIKAERDTFRVVSGVTALSGFGLSLLAGGLYFFDTAELPDTTVSVTPTLGGASFDARF